MPALVVLGIVGTALLIALAGSQTLRGELDPRATDAAGSRALATLLGQRGVKVHRVTRAGEAAQLSSDRVVVLVAFPDLVGPQALRQVGDLERGHVVLVAPGGRALSAVTQTVRPADGSAPVAVRPPECGNQDAVAAGPAELGGRTYTLAGGGERCYLVNGTPSLVFSTTRGGASLAVIGTGQPLSNRRLAEQGNAALSLNLLGADGSAEEVRWLMPSLGGEPADESRQPLLDILPGWVRLAAAQLLLAALLAALWRGRRLGPPVIEPLPVVVRSAESVEGRGRLYQRAQARDKAAESLRAGARDYLIPRLGLGRDSASGPTPAAVVGAVAARSRLPGPEIQAALYGPAPQDDTGLIHLADALDRIVRNALDPEVRRQ